MTANFWDQESLLIDTRNRLKTKNNMGFAHLTPLKVIQALYQQAETQKGVYVDIGAAYGIDAVYMVKAGARVVAVDLENQHLEVLQQRLKDEEQQRLEVRCQRFPDETCLESETYDAVLLSRVLIFLKPDNVDTALQQVYSALKKGGKVYVVTLSPFSEKWEPIQHLFQAHQELFPAQPLAISNLWKLLPQTRFFLPQCIQVFDQEALKANLEKNGFCIVDSGYESHYGTVDTYAIAQKE